MSAVGLAQLRRPSPLFGQHIIWSDMIGNTIGLAALALGWRRSIWTWPAQLLSGVILVAAYASAHLAAASASSWW